MRNTVTVDALHERPRFPLDDQLLQGLVFQLTSSYRVGLVSLLIFFVVGFLLLAAVPIRRAIVAAGNTPPRVL